jgi:predicted aspartyl protease
MGASLLTTIGPTLNVNVGFDPAWRPESGIRPAISADLLPALVDTGAGESCIDQLLAVQLGLPLVDRKAISGVHGSHMTNIYLAQLYVPPFNYTIYGLFAGVGLKEGGQQHHALIGRTFLQNFRLEYDGHTGSVKVIGPATLLGPVGTPTAGP